MYTKHCHPKPLPKHIWHHNYYWMNQTQMNCSHTLPFVSNKLPVTNTAWMICSQKLLNFFLFLNLLSFLPCLEFHVDSVLL